MNRLITGFACGLFAVSGLACVEMPEEAPPTTAPEAPRGWRPQHPKPPIDPLDFPRSCQDDPPPSTWQTSDPPPSTTIPQRVLHDPPPLVGTGNAALASVRAFLSWAAESSVEEREDGRRTLEAAAQNGDVARALIQEVERLAVSDPSMALIALSALGQQRHPIGVDFLIDFVRRPLPNSDRRVDGEDVVSGRMERLQSKAIAGLAFSSDPKARYWVLECIGNHPSKAVRAEAVRTFLFNNPRDGQRIASRYLRPSERAFLTRVEHVVAGDQGVAGFNARLERFLAANPHLTPPDPKRKLRCEDPGAPPVGGTPVPVPD